MDIDVLGAYLIDFKNNVGGELSGKHYGVVLSAKSTKNNTLLVAPLTSKKAGKKYRGGFTIDCTKYQLAPSYPKAFVKIRKIREIDASRILGKKKYDFDKEDKAKLAKTFYTFFAFLNVQSEPQQITE